jgi:hypothetical protein
MPTPQISEDTQLAVKQGAYWLDQVYPEWTDHINLFTLNLVSAQKCVLGQIAGEFGRVMDLAQARELGDPMAALYWMIDHGFCASHRSTYSELTDAWSNLVRERWA